MCTAFTLQSLQMENFFCRTMDFSYDIEPGFFIVPRNNLWYNPITMKKHNDCYSFIGIGQKTDSMLGFFDGVNEKGFAAAALYFAGYAYYDIPVEDKNKEPIASLDFLHYILGRCTSVDELDMILKSICVLGLPDPVTKIAAPLHWIATDKSGKCVVIEQTQNGLEIFDNPIGVMTNSPDFMWHMTNLRNYIEVSTIQKKKTHWGNVELTPFGQAGGTMLLPGGYTSPERFVKTAFLKTHGQVPKDGVDGIMTCFHIVENVSIPRGVVLTDKGTCDYTKYTAFINTNTCEYYFKTYDNSQIATIKLSDDYENCTHPMFLGNLKRPITFENL
ncbi:MAG: choloylglycine hydrolase family protein [Clostridium sp.]|nr:choloylglycine hydrolase family protein [Clostridium sp.]